MARGQRPPRLLPAPSVFGKEPDGFAPMSEADQETLASLIYIAGAVVGQGDDNTTVSNFINSLNNTVYSQYMQGGSLDELGGSLDELG